MSFFWPSMLYLLILIPVFIGLYFRLQGRRRKAIEKYGSLGFVQEGGHGPGARRHLPPILFLVSLTILTLALARPKTVLSLPRIEGTVILVFDVSGSMAAEDVQPTRLEAAKIAAINFVQRQPPSMQIGVVAFSDGSLSIQVPTNEQETILSAINRLSPQRGTSLANGILSALEAIATNNGVSLQPTNDPALPPSSAPLPNGAFSSAAIVLLTDGENNMSPDPLAAAQAAADLGVRIHTIGIGSPTGTILEVNGFTVFTQLDEPTLQQISQMTDGAYFYAENEEDLQSIYKNIDPQLVIKEEEMEVTSIFAGVGILTLLVGGLISLLWFSRLP
jgi:Ca-activated chloride channel family protein